MTPPMSAPRTLSDEKRAYWRTEIDKARQKRKMISDEYDWDGNLERYLPKARNDNGQVVAEVNVGVDFADVERKKAALLFDTPFIALVPDDEAQPAPAQPGQPPPPSTVVLHQELLNGLLGPRHANVKPTTLKAIFDCLCPAGIGPVLVGYHVTTQKLDVDAPVMGTDGQPLIDPVLGQPITEKQKVDVPIHERFFLSRVSPRALLIPTEFRDTEYRRAPWLGYEWRKPVSQVKREFKVPKDWEPHLSSDAEKPYFEPTDDTPQEPHKGDPLVHGVTIWYRKELDGNQGNAVHPELLSEITFTEGHEQPIEWKDNPHQTLDPNGRMTPDSMIGFPLRPLVLRDVSDSAWVPSDCAVTGPLTKEINKFRTQVIEAREGTKLVMAYDASKINPTAKDKIITASGVRWVPVEEAALAGGIDSVIKQVNAPSVGRENYTAADYIQRDRERILGIGDNQAGGQTQTRRTATETNAIQRNSEARFEQERNRVLEWYLDLVRAFDALVLRYADERMAEQILGSQKAQAWYAGKQALAGGYRYEVQMDSGKYLDVEADRRQFLQLFNFTAKSPHVNQHFMIQEMAKKFGFDPSQFIAQPQPEKPEPPKWNLSVAGQDLNPYGPQYPSVIAALAAAGVDTSKFPPAQQVDPLQATAIGMKAGGPAGPGQPIHGGAADKAERIDQHNLDETGALPGPRPAGVM